MYSVLFSENPLILAYSAVWVCNLRASLTTRIERVLFPLVHVYGIVPRWRTALHENEAISWALFTICQQNCSMRYRWLHICSIVPWGYPSLQVYRSVPWGYAAIHAYGIIPRGHLLIQLSSTVTRGNPCLHVFSAVSWMHTALHVYNAVRIMGIHTT